MILNIAEQSTEQAVILAKQAELEGADGLMLLPLCDIKLLIRKQ